MRIIILKKDFWGKKTFWAFFPLEYPELEEFAPPCF